MERSADERGVVVGEVHFPEVPFPIVELRHYRLHAGRRDELIDLFDREFVESQERVGMAILGQFRDLDDPDRFVWLRGFPDMASRAEALAGFYGGPAWKANSERANATMVDVDDVLLLRQLAGSGLQAGRGESRPPVGTGEAPASRLLAMICLAERPFDREFVAFFEDDVRPALVAAGAAPVACLWTEHAENNFPALPVRTGENAFVWFARFPSQADLDRHLDRLERPGGWRDEVLPALSARLLGTPRWLRLAPTAGSLLR